MAKFSRVFFLCLALLVPLAEPAPAFQSGVEREDKRVQKFPPQFVRTGVLGNEATAQAASLAFMATVFEDSSGESVGALGFLKRAEEILETLPTNSLAPDAARAIVYTAKAGSLTSLGRSSEARKALSKVRDAIDRHANTEPSFAFFACQAALEGLGSGNDDIVLELTKIGFREGLKGSALSFFEGSMGTSCGLAAYRAQGYRQVIEALEPYVASALKNGLPAAARADPYISGSILLLAMSHAASGDGVKAETYRRLHGESMRLRLALQNELMFEDALRRAAYFPKYRDWDASDVSWSYYSSLFTLAIQTALNGLPDGVLQGASLRGAEASAARSLLPQFYRVFLEQSKLALKLNRPKDAIEILQRFPEFAAIPFSAKPPAREGLEPGIAPFVFGEQQSVALARAGIADVDTILEQLIALQYRFPDYRDRATALSFRYIGFVKSATETAAAAAGAKVLSSPALRRDRTFVDAARSFARVKQTSFRSAFGKLVSMPPLLLDPTGNALSAIVSVYTAQYRDAWNTMQRALKNARPETLKSLSGLGPLELQEFQSGLKSNEAAIIVLTGNSNGFAFTVTRDMARLDVLALKRREAETLAAQIRAYLHGNGAKGAAAARQALSQLSAALDPAFRSLPKGVTSIYWMPDPSISEIPPHILFDLRGAGRGSEPGAVPYAGDARGLTVVTPGSVAFSGVRWLAERYAFTIAASPNQVGSSLGPRKSGAENTSYFAVADPSFSGASGAASYAMRSAALRSFEDDLRALPRLPESRAEVETIAKALGGWSTLLLGDDATEARLKSTDLSGYRYLSFATHGVAPGDIGGLNEPGLALTPPNTATDSDDGLLTAFEVADFKLNADLVILSACNTASTDGRTGSEAFSGLVRAFFFAGARNIVASNWPVNSQAATDLSVGMIQNMNKDLPASEALRQAMLGVLARDPDPRIWAPFVVVGSGGAFAR